MAMIETERGVATTVSAEGMTIDVEGVAVPHRMKVSHILLHEWFRGSFS